MTGDGSHGVAAGCLGDALQDRDREVVSCVLDPCDDPFLVAATHDQAYVRHGRWRAPFVASVRGSEAGDVRFASSLLSTATQAQWLWFGSGREGRSC
jgi:hypothetical protein